MLHRIARGGVALAIAFAFSGCGGGSALAPPVQFSAGSGASATASSVVYTLSAAGSTEPLPAAGEYGGTVTFPAFAVPPGTTVSASASASVTAAVQRAMALRAQSTTGTLDIYYAVRLTPSHDLVMPSVPGFSLQLPPAAHPGNQQFFYAISQPAPAGTELSFRTEGPASVDGRTLIFPASAIPLTLKAGVTYTFGFYGASTNAANTPSALLFVTTGNAILAYPLGANGDAAPVRTITGPHTALHGAWGIAHDAAGNIYVANESTNTITEYPADANGDVPPLRTIVQNSTVDLVEDVAIGPTGTIYVGNAQQGFTTSALVTEYAATASGSATPVRVIERGESFAAGIAIDAAGELVVGIAPEIDVFANNASGNAVPLRSIAGTSTTLGSLANLALGAGGTIYVADDSYPAPAIDVFAANAAGNAAPVARIQGPLTRLQIAEAVAVGETGEIYVANSIASNAEIDVFAPNADGNVAPVRVIAGPSTGLIGAAPGLTILPRALAFP